MFDLIIAAGGASTRTKTAKNKLLLPLSGRTVIENSILPFLSFCDLNQIIISAGQDTLAQIKTLTCPLYDKILFIEGGRSRTQSVANALKHVQSKFVLIHDGARPFITPEVIQSVLSGLEKHEAVIPAVALTDSIVYLNGGYKSCDRTQYKAVQTPQGFLASKIISAYNQTDEDFSDDASVYCQSFSDIVVVDGAIENKKITTSSDLMLPQSYAGVGFDTHRLVEGRKLILGGVDIPHTKGLLGHSDADVLIHAIMDALLSACGERDIGYFFPDTDPRYKDVSSVELLKKVMEILSSNNKKVWNVSATILAQKPKLSPHIYAMRLNLSKLLDVPLERVAVSATTTEGIGNTGREESISTIANVTLI